MIGTAARYIFAHHLSKPVQPITPPPSRPSVSGHLSPPPPACPRYLLDTQQHTKPVDGQLISRSPVESQVSDNDHEVAMTAVTPKPASTWVPPPSSSPESWRCSRVAQTGCHRSAPPRRRGSVDDHDRDVPHALIRWLTADGVTCSRSAAASNDPYSMTAACRSRSRADKTSYVA